MKGRVLLSPAMVRASRRMYSSTWEGGGEGGREGGEGGVLASVQINRFPLSLRCITFAATSGWFSRR